MQKCALVAGILLVLGAITALILIYVYHSNKSVNPEPLVNGKALNLESILGGDFYAKKNNGTWISKNELMFKDDLVSSLEIGVKRELYESIFKL